MAMNEYSPATIIMLAKALEAAAKGARDEIGPGEYKVKAEVTLSCDGTVKVGEDYTQRLVAKADPWLLLSVALSKLNGVTVEYIVREALAGGIVDEELKARADAAVQAVKDATVSECRGKVTWKGTVR